MNAHPSHWSVAIFTARESVTVAADCVRAVLAAVGERSATVDVLVNGNRQLADDLARMAPTWRRSETGALCRVWYLDVPDKGHTWNEYIRDLWAGGEVAFFIDGYAIVEKHAFARIASALDAHPEAWAASGTPSVGRTAEALREQMLREGGMHGNLYAMRGEAVIRLRALGFRLPLGIYRSDALIGAVFCFSFDPERSAWNARRIAVVPDATWTISPLRWSRPRDMVTLFKRKLRQYQGEFENTAYRDHLALQRRSITTLPETSKALVAGWMDANKGSAARKILMHPAAMHALYKLWRAPPLPKGHPPELLWESAGSGTAAPVALRAVEH